MASAPHGRRQAAALWRVFVARFFENEITGGSRDLRASFLWLVAFLAPLGILMPWARSFNYACIALVGGSDALRLLSIPDKTLYLGAGMVAAGMVGLMAWNALLVDRRDALVLGPLPVHEASVVRAKLAAVATYVGLVAVGMHLGASLCFGLILSSGSPFTFVVQGVVAHFVAAVLASLCVLFFIMAIQALTMAVAGPRIASRVLPLLQVVVAALVLCMLLLLPAISNAVLFADERWATPELMTVLRRCAPELGRVQLLNTGIDHTWVRFTPPAWFLGLYQWILGDDGPVGRRLAAAAVTAVASTIGATAAMYPVASRRLVTSALDGTTEFIGVRRVSALARGFPRLVTRASAARASVQFMLATLGRVGTHRLVLAIGTGVTVAYVLPIIGTEFGVVRASSVPSVVMLSAPLAVIVFSIATLRVAVALPGQVTAGWLVHVTHPLPRHARSGVWRTTFLLGVAPAVIVFSPVSVRLWGWPVTVAHAVVCLGVGSLLTETLLWRFRGMPCTRPWRPEQAGLRAWWPVYLGGFLVITQAAPRLTLLVYDSPIAVATVALTLLGVTFMVRWIGLRQSPIDDESNEEFDHVEQTLRLG